MAWLDWSNPVALWWVFLFAASVVNISVWFWLRFYRFSGVPFATLFSFRSESRSIIWLCAFYVFVCAFRSWLPRADVQRICLFDTWLSSVFLGRTVATVAELAFVAQWSIILAVVGRATKDIWVQRISNLILIFILIAETCSWYAVITTNYIGNVIEESLWGITYLCVGVAIIRLWFHLKGPMRLASWFAVIGCAGYVLFMFTIDVPMYVGRLKQDLLNDKAFLSFTQGIIDLNTRWHVTYSIEDWKTEIPWMTLYFTFAVLVSLALCLLPLKEDGWKKHLKV